MAEKEVMRGECLRFKSLSELDNKGTCVNCSCLQSQLSKVLEELKSLKTIIFYYKKNMDYVIPM